MLKIILLSIQILIILFFVLFIVNNQFLISFEINDLIYSLSSSYVFGFCLFLFVLIFSIQTFYFKIINRFNKYQLKRLQNKEKKGYNLFTRGMVAIANKDYKKASILSKKLDKFLVNDKSLFMLLHSEVLKKTKKFNQLEDTYNKMLTYDTTKELGEIGLMEYYLSLQDFHHAFLYAERLFIKNPNIENLYSNILQIIAKTNNWSQLINISQKAYDNKIITKYKLNEHRSVALFEISKIKYLSNLNDSIVSMKEAIKLRKYFTPYVKFLVELLIKDKNLIEAKKLIVKSWSENPNSELREYIIEVSAKLELDILKFLSTFKNINSKNEQNKLLLTQGCIVSKNWSEARKHIKEIMTQNPSKIICEFMANIELGENNDVAKSNSWKMRGDNSELENCWICAVTQQPQIEWSTVSQGGYFNSLEWKQIPMLYNQGLERLQIGK